jgi:hypothetical protein
MFALIVDCGNRMPSRQHSKLIAADEKERIAGNEERVRTALD